MEASAGLTETAVVALSFCVFTVHVPWMLGGSGSGDSATSHKSGQQSKMIDEHGFHTDEEQCDAPNRIYWFNGIPRSDRLQSTKNSRIGWLREYPLHLL